MKVRIKWISTTELSRSHLGHGILIFFKDQDNYDESNLVAFIDGFAWWHGKSDVAEVRILSPDSPRYAGLGVQATREIKQAIRNYVRDRIAPQTLSVWFNG